MSYAIWQSGYNLGITMKPDYANALRGNYKDKVINNSASIGRLFERYSVHFSPVYTENVETATLQYLKDLFLTVNLMVELKGDSVVQYASWLREQSNSVFSRDIVRRGEPIDMYQIYVYKQAWQLHYSFKLLYRGCIASRLDWWRV